MPLRHSGVPTPSARLHTSHSALKPVTSRPRTFHLPIHTLSYARVHYPKSEITLRGTSRYIPPVEAVNLHRSWAEALHTCFLSQIPLCYTTSHLPFSTAPKRPCSLTPPKRFRTLPRPMVCARVRSHQPAEQNGLSRSGYGEQERRGPGSLSLCESYLSSKKKGIRSASGF